MTLRLLSVDFERVVFDVQDKKVSRLVTVEVGSGEDWLAAVRFPHIRNDSGRSLGDDTLDEQVRCRAAEELVRLAAAVGFAA